MHGASQGAQAPTRKGSWPPPPMPRSGSFLQDGVGCQKNFGASGGDQAGQRKLGGGGARKKGLPKFFFVSPPRLGVKCGPTPRRRFGVHRPHTRSMPSKRWGSQLGLAPHATLMADLSYFCQKAHKTCPQPPKTIKKRIKGRQLSNHRWFDNCRRAPLHPTIMCGEPRLNPKTS